MKIAYICADAGIPVFGSKGASIHIQSVLRVLLKRGANITLFLQRSGGIPAPEFADINIVYLPALPEASASDLRAKASLDGNATLKQLLEQHGPFELVYERYSLWSWAGMDYASVTNTPSLLEVNAPLIDEQRTYRTLPFANEAKEVITRLLQQAGAVIAVSEGVKEWLCSFPCHSNKISVIENGVDPTRFSDLQRTASPLLRLGFIGTLKPWHGINTLIEAFALARHEGLPVTLTIIGDGPEKATLQHLLEFHGLQKDVRFTGMVAHADVPALLAEVDIGFAPYPQLSHFYFSPLKIYEYMAAGLPVIASDVGQLGKLVAHEERGLLVPPDSPAALKEAIALLLNNPDKRLQMGLQGREHVTLHHSWENVVRKSLALAFRQAKEL